ncbi:UDP-4-amino-4,6-dideoxy-N-acetyl-beta-L-altrosamine N-acetyltransferase [Campylobacter hepaticus]|uniref:UDP-4-amino-4, 6-dideoxy-N-acetyl-beta-L-altrosamine N-acetyltransferase n=1 Tax=Campylobacter hepaticus TaxID=1813019 RepID=UPI0029A29ADC|nr:UDP-4-amino-4,6-dideoxy-N-acetyl-beta-L-altrosamine N-acetyltransferase [Campylobacter hepaticus]MDX2330797.1 UDP-4-amino-4,6-dideoxy-N-acetyl-beta-L-altrosamine N-acetyltransferase [Campylobacter hepaticus]MDX2371412.1 UDP-4-amino-4,6-dideoxy-N-acetyl-beta-L-altrosamine N-acetyltransferase [Campylobacter hepaticus]MDX2396662.1 UDP-4-amino-4,6-dideoxy-N-acetyl-beta-L-altrosamine N-acetyltransferase [Campylobacter hepaticus]MDX5508570.1 UDP-4-amino-4,6-dideoxy-N-acetyl-beta-L-altrosamine N-ac
MDIIKSLSSSKFSWKNDLIKYEIQKKNILFYFKNNDKIILENFINLNYIDKEKIRSYRNHLEIKKYLYHTHHISKLEHKSFIKNLKSNTKKYYFCVKYRKMILGSINFEIKNNNTIEFGFYANPFCLIFGIGRVLENIAIYYCFYIKKYEILYLEAFKENQQIINLHKKFGFKELQNDNDKIIKMELNIKEYDERN